MTRSLTFLCLFLLSLNANGETVFTNYTFGGLVFSGVAYTNGSRHLNYRLHTPDTFEAGKKYPLIIYLHGAGQRGTDNEAMFKGANQMLSSICSQVAQEPAVILVPQCPLAPAQWVDTPWGQGSYSVDGVPVSDPMLSVKEIIQQLRVTYPIDAKRIYAVGVSMGGFGTWYLLMTEPDQFAAAVPCCGGADPSKANAVKGIPIKTGHGDADPTVPVAATREMVAALQSAGAGSNIQYTEIAGGNHAAGWEVPAADPELMGWLFSQLKQFNIITSLKTGTLPVEGYVSATGNGFYDDFNNGLVPNAGTNFYGFSQTSIAGYRTGVAYARFSSLGLGSDAVQAGTYMLVMKVASNGAQNWPGVKDMTTTNRGSGYACGFFTTVGSGSTNLAVNGKATLDSMIAFNQTAGVTYTADSSILAASDPLPFSRIAQDTWYSVTSTWIIAEGSAVVGTDPYVGLGFEVGNGNSGTVWVDDSTLIFIPMPESITLRNPSAGQLAVEFNAGSGLGYQIQWCSSLATGTWQNVGGTITGADHIVTWLDDGTETGALPHDSDQRFYRIRRNILSNP